jgi:predicted membrane-bound spermidine synthase
MILFFCFFLMSGFCSLVYQVVWLRVAMADFGITTPLISIVLSVFMAGLALGSWGGGHLVRRFESRPASFFIGLYAASELAIGVSGLAVRPLLGLGRALLAARVEHAAWGSSGYYLASGGWIGLVLLPFCTCMGATFPLAMAGIRAAFHSESPRSFSYLYLANVLGAMAGAFGSAFVFIEWIGFSRTLLLAAALNALIAAMAWAFARSAIGSLHRSPRPTASEPSQDIGDPAENGRSSPLGGRANAVVLPLLFATGLSSLAMEVVWTRQFVPFLGPVVYSFATMLAVYLAATAAGSRIYRVWIGRAGALNPHLRTAAAAGNAAILAGWCALLPLLAADPRIPSRHRLLIGAVRVAWGIGPFCGVLGFLTPMLVDRWSAGDPGRAGRAYAVNALGCIAGPLLSGFLLLPIVGERWTLVLLSFPLFLGGVCFSLPSPNKSGLWQPKAACALVASVLLIILTRDFETLYPGAQVRRDHTATVIATGQGMDRMLRVNGVGITNLTPITKMMAHLPLASLESPPQRVLILCFGMGTSFRSALSWGVPVTAVELVPSVPSLFGYFHRDAQTVLASPRATIVIDDARRFLERTQETFDVIVIDPPPPIEAAGSSLLYSREFYQLAARRLRPGGILQQWLPGGEPIVKSAVAQALGGSFPYVRVFHSIEGWGHHFLASATPMIPHTAAELARRLPLAAAGDLLEWGPAATVETQFQPVVTGEIPLQTLIDADPHAPMLTDDRPINEYYFLRRTFR